MTAEPYILLEGSAETAFEYTIAGGMTVRDAEEWEAMDSRYVLGEKWPAELSGSVDLHHRMNYMRKRGLGFSFVDVKDPDMKNLMEDIDPELPRILAVALADFYRNGTSKLSDLLENERSERIYRPVKEFLSRLAKSKGIESNPDELLRTACFKAVMADKFGCTSLEKTGKDYRTLLILQIECL